MIQSCVVTLATAMKNVKFPTGPLVNDHMGQRRTLSPKENGQENGEDGHTAVGRNHLVDRRKDAGKGTNATVTGIYLPTNESLSLSIGRSVTYKRFQSRLTSDNSSVVNQCRNAGRGLEYFRSGTLRLLRGFYATWVANCCITRYDK